MSNVIEFVRAGVRRPANISREKLIEAYVKAGWALVPVPHGTKAPRAAEWNKRENCITTMDGVGKIKSNLGIAHAYCKSPSCALDIDSLDPARDYLLKRGVDLNALMTAADAVMISSGKPNRAKLLYALPEPLRSLSVANGAFELRCATKGNLTVHDLLPPSIHPETGRPYEWILGSAAQLAKIPQIPSTLLSLWRQCLSPAGDESNSPRTNTPSADIPELRELLQGLDPDGPYDEWVTVGMALHHESRGSVDGLTLWNEWSSQGRKYKSIADLEGHWRSFKLDMDAPVTIGSLRRRGVASPKSFRPIIQLRNGDLHVYAANCEQLLGNEIYVRERALVRIGGAQEVPITDGISRDGKQSVIIPATTEFLRRRLNQLAQFETFVKREKTWVAVDCPKDLAFNIAGQGDWPKLRKLDAIARAPFARRDGSICEEPGYDPISFVFHAPNERFPPVPKEPTFEHARQALDNLLEPFQEFPFSGEEAKSAFVAAVLTEVVRTSIDTSPAFFYTAPSPGTGKTLLSEMPSRVVHGCGPSLRPWTEGNEELRKNLFASLMAGDRNIGYDNVPSGIKVRSPTLCGFLTADVYSDRKLGVSEVPSLPNRTVVFLTGNNITPTGDLARRSIVIRLDANSERLRERRFKQSDLRSYVASRRAELLIGLLTIVRAYVLAGSPINSIPLPAFERWSKLVRGPLVWLGMADPVTTQTTEADDEAAPIAEAFRQLANDPTIGLKEFSASELARACMFPGASQLLSSLEAAGCNNPTDSKCAGYWLRNNRDRIGGGLKLKLVGKPKGLSTWQLEAIE